MFYAFFSSINIKNCEMNFNSPHSINIPHHENMSALRVELGINAQKIMQHLLLHNETIENQIKAGIEAAFNEMIGSEERFQDAIKEAVKEEIGRTINDAARSWAVKQKISDIVNKALDSKIEGYANQLAEKMLGDLS